MSNIVKTREDLVKLKEYIKLIQTKWLTKDTMEEIITGIIPKDANGNNLVNVKIMPDGRRVALYSASTNTVEFSIEKCKKWLIVNLEELSHLYGVEDKKLYGYYLSLFVMLHEVEHSYQYLIGQGKVDCSIPMVKNGYKTLTELIIKPNYILPHPIKEIRRAIALYNYLGDQFNYVIERNAHAEASSALLALAYENGHKEMIDVFTDMNDCYLSIGYTDDCKGSFYHTFKDLYMMDKYRRICDGTSVSVEDRIRYGMEIPNYKRLELLDKIKRRTN